MIPRTGGRSTAKLVDLLEPLTKYGPSLEEVLIEGMGRFPVAGRAHYSDDWLNPRFTPTFHLHKGLDIFAEFGTPIRAPDAGVITRLSNNPSGGGIGMWLGARGGDRYYFAHLQRRADAVRVGLRVETGEVIGYVGDTGNARGGVPHLHFEVHRGGPIPPKPIVDGWLDEAEDRAPAWVDARRRELENAGSEKGSTAATPWRRGAPVRALAFRASARPVPGSPSDVRSVATARAAPADAADVVADTWSSVAVEVPWRTPGQLLVVLGFLLVGWAVSWRVFSAWLAARRLRAALSDPEPSLRASAVEVATAQGLARHAGILAQLVRRETSGQVLRAVADAVGRNLWEPGDSPRLVELRLWADQWRRERHAGQPSSNGHGPRRDGDETGGIRVLVTGAGGPAGVAVIRALADRHHVIAVDADPLAAGLHLAEMSEIVPAADDPAFLERLLDVVDRTGAKALISTLTEEMIVLSRDEDEVAQHVTLWLAPPLALEACRDKWRFVDAMREAGIAVPPTALGTTEGVPGPWIVKPRFSRGSKGVYDVERPDDVAAVMRNIDDPIVQTRLPGREFTVDTLINRAGELVGAVPRWRLETKAGISTKGRTFTDDRVIEVVAAAVSALHLQGAANVQGFVDGDDVSLIEVNPRFSGGLPLSLAAGADLVGEYLRGVMQLPIRCDRLVFREGTTMIRHFQEIYA